MENLRDRVILRMKKLGLSQSGLAKILREQYGLERTRQSTIQSLVKKRTDTFRKMSELAGALKTNVSWLTTGVGNPDELDLHKRSININRDPFVIEEDHTEIPLLSASQIRPGYICLDVKRKIGTTVRHPEQRKLEVGNCFAFHMPDESMSPKWDQSDVVYIALNRTPTVGKYCLIELSDGNAIPRRLIRITPTEYVCQQLNPVKQKSWPIAQVKLHAIVY